MLQARCYESIVDYMETKRTDWMQIWPGQCVLNCSQVHWTKETEDAMRTEGAKGVQKCLEVQMAQLDDMVALVRSPDLAKLARKSVGALAVIDVHARDTTKKMVAEGVSAANEFTWLVQMRYYWQLGVVGAQGIMKEGAHESTGSWKARAIGAIDRCGLVTYCGGAVSDARTCVCVCVWKHAN